MENITEKLEKEVLKRLNLQEVTIEQLIQNQKKQNLTCGQAIELGEKMIEDKFKKLCEESCGMGKWLFSGG